MNLKTLAKKASRLPEIEFDFAGVERWHPEVFKKEVKDLKSVIRYIDNLRGRMEEQSDAIKSLAEAYEKLREIILEADIESEGKGIN